MRLLRPLAHGDAEEIRPALDYIRELYRAEVRYTDAAVGALLGELDRLGLRERTLVVLTSDHGEALGERGLLQHGTGLHREVLQVPLILRFPDGRHAGTRLPHLARTIDIMPTVLEAVGAGAPAGLQGRSLLPLLAETTPEAEETLSLAEAISSRDREGDLKAVRSREWSFIRHAPSARRWLFRLDEDPRELVDLGVRHADVEEDLELRLDEILDSSLRIARGLGDRDAPDDLDEETRDRLRELGYVD